MDDGILAVTVTESNQLVGTSLRKGFPKPARLRLSMMLLQAEIIFSITRTSEDFHGRTRYVALRYANVDECLFLIDAENRQMMIISTKPDTRDAGLMESVAVIMLARNGHDERVHGGRVR